MEFDLYVLTQENLYDIVLNKENKFLEKYEEHDAKILYLSWFGTDKYVEGCATLLEDPWENSSQV